MPSDETDDKTLHSSSTDEMNNDDDDEDGKSIAKYFISLKKGLHPISHRIFVFRYSNCNERNIRREY